VWHYTSAGQAGTQLVTIERIPGQNYQGGMPKSGSLDDIAAMAVGVPMGIGMRSRISACLAGTSRN